jgi:radical SAM protein with 4Fe4S-binding SPASM domain
MKSGKRLYLNVWDSCNLDCRHCFNEEGKGQDEVLSFAEIIALVEEAQKVMGITEIQMTGGEPTQRPDIISLMNEVCSKRVHISLQTNGVFNRELCDSLLEFPKESLSLIVSLDGIRTNEDLRGLNTTTRTIENIKVLSRKFPIRINTLLSSKITWNEIEYIAELAEGYDLSLVFNPVCPSGRADASLLMPPQTFFDWMYRLEKLRRRGLQLRKNFDIVDDRLIETENCPVRKGATFHVNADGRVHACGFLVNNPTSYAGSIRKHSLVELMNMFPPDSKTVPSHCLQCEFYTNHFCHAGCPARIFALHQDFDAIDFYCMAEYVKK